jgi:hypothetical protein
MLDALDETIKSVLRELGGLDSDEVDIAFEAPDREWAARVGKPTVNCYLYDIRENLERRQSLQWTTDRQSNGRALKRPAPRHFDLSYVCTAWTADVEDEHRLLWRVLATLIRCPELPPHLLQGNLAQIEWPVITEVAQPDGLLRDPADVWSALDNRIRPSVNVVVTLPLDDRDPIEAPLVLTRRLRFDENGRTLEYIQIAGTVTGEDGKPLPNVVVRVRDHAYATVSTADGRFWLSGLPAGTYTLVAEAATTSVQREVSVPGTGYDIVVVGGSDVEPETKQAGREATRRKKGR